MGWFLGLKTDGNVFPFLKTSDQRIIIPFEFSHNPNFKFRLDGWTVYVTQPIVLDGISWQETKWCDLEEIKEMKLCITPNVDKQMEYRKNLVGRLLEINGEQYKIDNIVQHLHCLTRYSIYNLETKKWTDIEYNDKEWSRPAKLIEI
jgi:hypothetical protein